MKTIKELQPATLMATMPQKGFLMNYLVHIQKGWKKNQGSFTIIFTLRSGFDQGALPTSTSSKITS